MLRPSSSFHPFHHTRVKEAVRATKGFWKINLLKEIVKSLSRKYEKINITPVRSGSYFTNPAGLLFTVKWYNQQAPSAPAQHQCAGPVWLASCLLGVAVRSSSLSTPNVYGLHFIYHAAFPDRFGSFQRQQHTAASLIFSRSCPAPFHLAPYPTHRDAKPFFRHGYFQEVKL